TSARVWVVDASGRIVAVTDADDVPLVGEVVDAPGLAAALRGERAATVETDAEGPEVLYLATPLVRDGELLGATRVAYALADVRGEVSTLHRALLVGLRSEERRVGKDGRSSLAQSR